jgi:predicted secreted protein
VTYRVCTASASEATSRYLKEGDQIARGLAGRYGG